MDELTSSINNEKCEDNFLYKNLVIHNSNDSLDKPRHLRHHVICSCLRWVNWCRIKMIRIQLQKKYVFDN